MGQWNIKYAQIVIVTAGGTVYPVYTGQDSVSFQPGADNTPGVTGLNVTTARDNSVATNTTLSVQYYHGDQIGSSRLLTGGDGWPTWQGTFLPFGEEYSSSFTNNHYKFTGKERDNESGLDYFGARYYGSSLGRWLTPDWAAQATAVPYAEFSDPQSLNLYSYVRNVPTVKIDLDGHDGFWSWVADKFSPPPPPPPPPPAPEPPAVITPGTPQYQLAQIEQAARNNSSFAPVGQPGSPGRTTYCNIATTTQVQQAGGPTGALTNSSGTPNLANTDARTLAQPGSGYHEVTAYQAQNYTNSTGVPAVAVQTAQGHGHITPVAPELVPGTQQRLGQAPLVNNIGARMQLDTADRAFSSSRPVHYYAPDPPAPVIRYQERFGARTVWVEW